MHANRELSGQSGVRGRRPGIASATGSRTPRPRPAGAPSAGPRVMPPEAGSDTAAPPSPIDQLKASMRKLLTALLERGFGLALEKVEDLALKFDRLAAQGGPKLGALLGGARAAMAGQNPIWGAIRGAVSAMSPATKALLVAVLVLAIVLLPVTAVLLLVALIVLAVVLAVRAGSSAR